MSNEVLCKDCKHSFRTIKDLILIGFNNSYAYRCRKAFKEDEVKIDLVIGFKKDPKHYESCNLVRLHDASYKNNCGKQGLWWEPKDQKNFFLYLKRI